MAKPDLRIVLSTPKPKRKPRRYGDYRDYLKRQKVPRGPWVVRENENKK